MAEVGVLELTIEDNSKKAGAGLDKLTGALSSLKKQAEGQLGLKNINDQLKTFANNINRQKNTMTVIKNITSFGKAMEGLSKIKKAIDFDTKPLENLKKAIGDGFKLSGNPAGNLEKIREAMSGEWNGDAAIAHMKNLKEAADSFGRGKTAEKLTEVARALAAYNRAVASKPAESPFQSVNSTIQTSVKDAKKGVIDYQKIADQWDQENSKLTFKEPVATEKAKAPVNNWRDQMAGIQEMNNAIREIDRSSVESMEKMSAAVGDLAKTKGGGNITDIAEGVRALASAAKSVGKSYSNVTYLANAIGKLKDASKGFKIPDFTNLIQLQQSLQANYTSAENLKKIAAGMEAIKGASIGFRMPNVKGIEKVIAAMETSQGATGNAAALAKGMEDAGTAAVEVKETFGQIVATLQDVRTTTKDLPALGITGTHVDEESQKWRQYGAMVKDAYEVVKKLASQKPFEGVASEEIVGSIIAINNELRVTGEIIDSFASKFQQFMQMFYEWLDMQSRMALGTGTGMETRNSLMTQEGWDDWKKGAIEAEGTVGDVVSNIAGYIGEVNNRIEETGRAVSNVDFSQFDPANLPFGELGSTLDKVGKQWQDFAFMVEKNMNAKVMPAVDALGNKIDMSVPVIMEDGRIMRFATAMDSVYDRVDETANGLERVGQAAHGASAHMEKVAEAEKKPDGSGFEKVKNAVDETDEHLLHLQMKLEAVQKKLDFQYFKGQYTGQYDIDKISSYLLQIDRLKDQIDDYRNKLEMLKESDGMVVVDEEAKTAAEHFMEVNAQIDAMQARIDELKIKLGEGIVGGTMDTKQLLSTSKEIERLEAQMQKLKDSISMEDQAPDAIGAARTEVDALVDSMTPAAMAVQNLKDQIAGLTARENDMKAALAGAIASGQVNQDELNSRAAAIRRVVDEKETLIQKLKEANNEQSKSSMIIHSAIKEYDMVKDGIKKLFAPLTKLKQQFANIAKRMMMRAIIRTFVQGMKEGLENVYNYSKVVGTSFAPAMDSAASAIMQLKNSLGAAVAPLLQALIPILQEIVAWVVEALNKVNQFFALLNGQTSWTRAKLYATEAFNSTTKGAKKASSAMKELLADWDELNIIQSESGGGSGSGSGYSAADYKDMFEQVDTFDPTVSGLAEVAKSLGGIKGLVATIGAGFLTWKIGKTVLRQLLFSHRVTQAVEKALEKMNHPETPTSGAESQVRDATANSELDNVRNVTIDKADIKAMDVDKLNEAKNNVPKLNAAEDVIKTNKLSAGNMDTVKLPEGRVMTNTSVNNANILRLSESTTPARRLNFAKEIGGRVPVALEDIGLKITDGVRNGVTTGIENAIQQGKLTSGSGYEQPKLNAAKDVIESDTVDLSGASTVALPSGIETVNLQLGTGSVNLPSGTEAIRLSAGGEAQVVQEIAGAAGRVSTTVIENALGDGSSTPLLYAGGVESAVQDGIEGAWRVVDTETAIHDGMVDAVTGKISIGNWNEALKDYMAKMHPNINQMIEYMLSPQGLAVIAPLLGMPIVSRIASDVEEDKRGEEKYGEEYNELSERSKRILNGTSLMTPGGASSVDEAKRLAEIEKETQKAQLPWFARWTVDLGTIFDDGIDKVENFAGGVVDVAKDVINLPFNALNGLLFDDWQGMGDFIEKYGLIDAAINGAQALNQFTENLRIAGENTFDEHYEADNQVPEGIQEAEEYTEEMLDAYVDFTEDVKEVVETVKKWLPSNWPGGGGGGAYYENDIDTANPFGRLGGSLFRVNTGTPFVTGGYPTGESVEKAVGQAVKDGNEKQEEQNEETNRLLRMLLAKTWQINISPTSQWGMFNRNSERMAENVTG